MKVLVTGGKGQLGSEIRKISSNFRKIIWLFTDIEEFDLMDCKNIKTNLLKIDPDLIINCAAYTNVDNAEHDYDNANILNYKAIDNISKWTNINCRKLIHISTDYVFDGCSTLPLNEDALTSPVNKYGLTKLKGEKVCLINDPSSIIIRTSWLYSSFGNNFVKTICSLMEQKDSLNVINDQIGSPTYAADLAEVIVKIFKSENWISGIYHYSNEGQVSWFDFANDIKNFNNFQTQIKGIPTDEYPTAAKRPKYSLLDKAKIKETYNIKIPHYRDSLKKCLKILQNEK